MTLMEDLIVHFIKNPQEAFALVSGNASLIEGNAKEVFKVLELLASNETVRMTAGFWT